MTTYYSFLQISPQATTTEIQQVYFQLRKKWSTALNVNNQAQLSKQLAFLETAYAVLRDPEQRVNYDAALEIERQKQRLYLEATHQAYETTRQKLQNETKGSPAWLNLQLNSLALLRKAQLCHWEIGVIRWGIPLQNLAIVETQLKLVARQLILEKELATFAPQHASNQRFNQLVADHKKLTLQINQLRQVKVSSYYPQETELSVTAPQPFLLNKIAEKQASLLHRGSTSLLVLLGFFILGLTSWLTVSFVGGRNIPTPTNPLPQNIAVLPPSPIPATQTVAAQIVTEQPPISNKQIEPVQNLNQPENSATVTYAFVDPELQSAFRLVLDDPDDGRLALVAIQNKMPIQLTNEIQAKCEVVKDALACFIGGIGFARPESRIWVSNKILTRSDYVMASILIHELTHAQQFREATDKISQKTCYLSQEFDAHRNQLLFMRRNQQEDVLVNYTTYEGRFDEYLLYQYLKGAYSGQCEDDLLWQPKHDYPPSNITFYPECLTWGKVELGQVGQTVCVYGNVDHIVMEDAGTIKNQKIYFSADEKQGVSILFTSTEKYVKVEPGTCILAKNNIQLIDNQLILATDENNRPSHCEAE